MAGISRFSRSCGAAAWRSHRRAGSRRQVRKRLGTESEIQYEVASYECFLSAIRVDAIQLDTTTLTSRLEAEAVMLGRERIATRKVCAHRYH